ncbi:alpha-keto acid decarboxylase family protein [Spirulina subsalsa FACHB-351]|uniref:Alpha-keto-acid decarboxylase n=1 Tax=Spirulina subsalsa FACHB-351 TaxID=234711 RepID=A0ABT3LB72_9CYAN|nr:thiamine pyrophosphate-binding protein [Spirulina subsalsa]MCW6038765.1 alpha-keto acid decarboxylase family protein [Spirulina subsalsa FACHB-351]
MVMTPSALDLQGSRLKTTTIGQYLVEQLEALGIGHIFGVPGDYVLKFMDLLLESSLELVGTCNELNAGYAADAYARLKGVGAVCVTYGVGGLSLVNAIAGAYAEQVPLIVISGAPPTTAHQNLWNPLLLHHTTGDYNLQQSVLEKVTVAAVTLTPDQATQQIDQTLAACLRYKRPVYIEIPVDLVAHPCTIPAQKPLVVRPSSDEQALREAVEEAVMLLERAKYPVILAGVELHRYGIQGKLVELVEKTGYPIASTLLGKSSITEMHPQFIGNYVGALSRDYVRDRVEQADCILCLGAILSDTNLGGYTAQLERGKLINANLQRVQIKHHYYSPIYLGDFMDCLMETLSPRSPQTLNIQPTSTLLGDPFVVQSEAPLTNARFYQRMNHFMGEQNIAIAETGDAIIACIDLPIRQDAKFIGQAFYMSIGYSLPACLGAGLAQRNHRILLFIGDGSFQMTCQELSTIIRHGLNPIVFLINNDGYTIERMIHDGAYNDLQPWKYHKMPEIFGESWSCEVHTEGDLEEALATAQLLRDRLCFIEIHLDRLDCCERLVNLTSRLGS